MSVCPSTPDLLCNLFAALALGKGLILTSGAKTALKELLQQSFPESDPLEIVESMVEELSSFDRSYPVRPAQIRQLSIPTPPRQRRVIGFAPR